MSTNADLTAIVNDNTAFAIDLYHQLTNKPGNLLFSPYSISVALAMTYAGARGATATQMAQALHFGLEQTQLHPAFAALQDRLNAVQQAGHVKLGVANSLWPHKQYAFLPEFMTLLKECYGVEITPVDYRQAAEAARQLINAWVEAKTEKKIVELIPDGTLDDLVRLVLVNAICFKGDWARQFDPTRTQDAPFWITPDKSVTVPMMHQTTSLRYQHVGDVHALELPYAGNDLSMSILLPDRIDGLDELQASLTVERLAMWTQQLWEVDVEVFLPKFKTEFAVTLNKVLEDLGMPDAFNQFKANFSGMDGREKWLYIAFVLHKAFIDVNEEGTEAAATAVIMKARGLPELSVAVRADHPFIFLIRDNSTGSVLFMGRVSNPMA